MINPESQSQIESFRHLAQGMGISGVAYIDYDPADGLIRIKMKVSSPEQQAQMTSIVTQGLVQIMQMMGLQVKTHQKIGG
ncbi:MAG: hypothetical protein C4555_00170 [Dehalococcoidia bacterium]|nr:MAG: hypothetical protein C4555_00170 [Dehalococcoidia bacterium]